jgi:hypothetical protein
MKSLKIRTFLLTSLPNSIEFPSSRRGHPCLLQHSGQFSLPDHLGDPGNIR